jgi:hypothetical protein
VAPGWVYCVECFFSCCSSLQLPAFAGLPVTLMYKRGICLRDPLPRSICSCTMKEQLSLSWMLDLWSLFFVVRLKFEGWGMPIVVFFRVLCHVISLRVFRAHAPVFSSVPRVKSGQCRRQRLKLLTCTNGKDRYYPGK